MKESRCQKRSADECAYLHEVVGLLCAPKHNMLLQKPVALSSRDTADRDFKLCPKLRSYTESIVGQPPYSEM